MYFIKDGFFLCLTILFFKREERFALIPVILRASLRHLGSFPSNSSSNLLDWLLLVELSSDGSSGMEREHQQEKRVPRQGRLGSQTVEALKGILAVHMS